MISLFELRSFIDETYHNQNIPPGITRLILPKRFTISNQTVTHATTASATLNISANGDFFVTRVVYKVNNAGAAITANSMPIANLRVQVQDTATDEQWFNLPTDINTVWGTNFAGDYGDEPYIRVVGGRTTLNVNITSYEASQDWNLDLTFAGVLVKLVGPGV